MEGGIIGSICFLACLVYLPNNVVMEEVPTPGSGDTILSQADAIKLMNMKYKMNLNATAQDDDENRRSGLPEDGSSWDSSEGHLKISSFVYPNQIKGYQTRSGLQCITEGDMYFINTGVDCYVCACVYEGRGISPKCVRCSDCMAPRPTRPPRPPPTTPPPPPSPPTSCYPFQEGEYFQNPLNPCQICVCWSKINNMGGPDIQIICQENQECVTMSTTTPRPRPTTRPTRPTIYPTTFRPTFRPTTDRPWYTTTTRPPHGSCAPYRPNIPYTSPVDECLMCVCREYKNQWNTEIDIICKTKPECCIIPDEYNNDYVYLNELCRYHKLNEIFVVPGFLCKKFVCRSAYGQVYAEIINDPQCNSNELIIPDPLCQRYGPGVEFANPDENCKVCTCEIVGSVLALICKKSSSCSQQMIVPGFQIEVIFLAPFCQYQPPYEDFAIECSVCSCSPVYNYVVANCRPQIDCSGPSPVRIPGPGLHGGNPGFSIGGSSHMGGELHLTGAKQKVTSTVIHTDTKQYPGHQITMNGASYANGKIVAMGEANSQIKVQGYRDKNGAPDAKEVETKSGRERRNLRSQ